jgi:VanZ family protein
MATGISAVWRRLISLLQSRPIALLVAYWVLVAIITHIPPFVPPVEIEPEPLIGKDKIAHFFGYAGLAFLLLNVFARGGSHAATDVAGTGSPEQSPLRTRGFRLGAVPILATVATCAVYGVIDELTQPPFGRTADPKDYVANLIGTAFGILLIVLLRNSLRAHATDAS